MVSNFNFSNPYYFYLTLLAGLVAILFLAKEKKKLELIKKYFSKTTLGVVVPNFDSIRRNNRRVFILDFIVIILLITALSRPQFGFTERETTLKGVDIVLAVDISQSMLAEDVKPSRLEKVKRVVQDLITIFKGDRVSLVTFAGTAFIDIPLTVDYGIYQIFLDILNPLNIPLQGTNIPLALEKSLQALKINLRQDSSANAQENSNNSRAIILMTDGEDFSGDLESYGDIIKKNNVKLYIIGIGTEQGAPIPTETGLKKDSKGQVIMTKLNQAALQKLASDTGGMYLNQINTLKDSQNIYLTLKKELKDQELGSQKTRIWNEYFQIPLLLGLMLIIIRILLLENFFRVTD